MSKKTYIDECLDRAEKATTGPWKAQQNYRQDDESDLIAEEYSRIGPVEYAGCGTHMLACPDNDAEFIAHARTDVPELARRLKEACRLVRVAGWHNLADELEAPLEDK